MRFLRSSGIDYHRNSKQKENQQDYHTFLIQCLLWRLIRYCLNMITSVRLKVEQWQLIREGRFMDSGCFLRKGAPELDSLENGDRQNL